MTLPRSKKRFAAGLGAVTVVLWIAVQLCLVLPLMSDPTDLEFE